MSIGNQGLAGKLQRGYCLFAGHRWKRLQEFVEGIAGFQIIEEILDRDPCSDKHGRTAKNIRVAVYNCSGHNASRLQQIPQYDTATWLHRERDVARLRANGQVLGRADGSLRCRSNSPAR